MRAAALVLTLLALIPVLAYAGLTLGYRLEAVDLGTVFGSLRWLVPGLALGGAAAVVAALLMAVKRAPFPALVSLLVGLVAFAMVAGPVLMRRTASTVPPIHDITTDTEDPPAFVAVLPLREGAPNPAAYDPTIAEQQRAAYDLAPLIVEHPYAEVFPMAIEALRREGLELVASVPEEGRIEATATTRWFGFKDDVVLRLRDAHGVATVVDMRSKSRVGQSDVGVNAARIERVLSRLDEIAEEV